MPIIIDTRALLRPPFTAAEFTPTQWDTAEAKADFANRLCKFIAADFKQTLFTKSVYRRLSNAFGHIAHYDLHGFYGTFFESSAGKIEFLDQTLHHRCYGDPSYTFSDVERAIIARLRKTGLLEAYRALRAAEIERSERATLARLKAQYEGCPAMPSTGEPLVLSPVPRPVSRTSSADQPSLF
ncbi:MAG: hypothetical protein KGH75_01575 [Rhodospirillales bacterium]|nr:hypothetical protein [Rhodospirillales bacterium]